MRTGYYPFFVEGVDHYYDRLEQAVNEILETDLPSLEKIDFASIYKMKKLLMVIAELVHFKPNVSKLSKQIGLDRNTFIKYIQWLERADLLFLLNSDTSGISRLNKPEKIYLNNSNLLFAMSEDNSNTGTVRETFFYNQLQTAHRINYSNKSDFLVDRTYTFEVGGKNKSQKQIAGVQNSYIAADNIEYAYKNTIPLWLLGFLY